jgi:hypothetical protein
MLSFLNLSPFWTIVLSIILTLGIALLALMWTTGLLQRRLRSLIFGAQQKHTSDQIIRAIEKSRFVEGIIVDVPDQSILGALQASSQSQPRRVQLAVHFSLEKHLKDFRRDDVLSFRDRSREESVLTIDFAIFKLERNNYLKINDFQLSLLYAALIRKRLEDLGRNPLYHK